VSDARRPPPHSSAWSSTRRATALQAVETSTAHNPRHLGAGQISEASDKARSGSGGQNGDRLEEARRRFWSNYPEGPEIAAAATDFATALLLRDLLFLHMYLPEGPDGPRARMFDALVSLADGGVPASALFLDWVRKVREHLGVRGTQFIVPSPAQVLSAIGARSAAYEKYRIARDFAEFDRESRDPSWVTDGRTFAIMSLMRGRRLQPDEAAAEYQVLITLFGASTVDGAGEQLRRARRRVGMLQDLAGFGLASDRTVARANAFAPAGHVVVQGPSLLEGLIAVMAKSDPRAFLARTMHDSTGSWRPTAEAYGLWTAAVGEQVLLDTVRKVMAAPARYSGLLQVPELEREQPRTHGFRHPGSQRHL
jgi:hypothetical protein